MFEQCEQVYSYWPSGSAYRGPSLVMLIVGVAACASFLGLQFYLWRQRVLAARSSFAEGRTGALIFPLYTQLLWACSLATIVDALSDVFLVTSLGGGNSILKSALYGGVWALYHLVFEFVALLMLHPGVGSRSAMRAGSIAAVWAAITWLLQSVVAWSAPGSTLGLVLSTCWSSALILFYGVLWLAPLRRLYRRPCVFGFARFWCAMRLLLLLSVLLRHFGVVFGYCVYVVVQVGFQSPLVAWVVYRCLLDDCRYWLGVLKWEQAEWTDGGGGGGGGGRGRGVSRSAGGDAADTDGDAAAGGAAQQASALASSSSSARAQRESLRRPLLGTTLPALAARTLARAMDRPAGGGSKALSPGAASHSADGAQGDGWAASNLPGSASVSGSGGGYGGGYGGGGVRILNFAFLSIDEPSAASSSTSSTAAASGPGRPQQVLLGAGSSARVYRGRFRNKPVAIKMLFCPELTPDVVRRFYHEATLLSQLRHPNVVRVEGVCVLPPAICLVMELCEGGNLFDFLRREHGIADGSGGGGGGGGSGSGGANPGPGGASARGADLGFARRPLTLSRQLALCLDCALAVAYLHSGGGSASGAAILHLDLKSLNFLLGSDGRVKIADLELSREIVVAADRDGPGGAGASQQQQQQGHKHGSVVSGSELSGFAIPETLYWLAPELMQGLAYGPAADVYSLALVLWEVFTASVPFRALEESLVAAARNVRYREALGAAAAAQGAKAAAAAAAAAGGVSDHSIDMDARPRRGRSHSHNAAVGAGSAAYGRYGTDSRASYAGSIDGNEHDTASLWSGSELMHGSDAPSHRASISSSRHRADSALSGAETPATAATSTRGSHNNLQALTLPPAAMQANAALQLQLQQQQQQALQQQQQQHSSGLPSHPARRARRSHSTSRRGAEGGAGGEADAGGEESEMCSTPSSRASSTSRAEPSQSHADSQSQSRAADDQSPPLQPHSPPHGPGLVPPYFLSPTAAARDAAATMGSSPPPLSRLVSADESALVVPAPLPASASLLTRENLRQYEQQTRQPQPSQPQRPSANSAVAGSAAPTAAAHARDSDPILREWKRMHGALHANPVRAPDYDMQAYQRAGASVSQPPQQQTALLSPAPTVASQAHLLTQTPQAPSTTVLASFRPTLAPVPGSLQLNTSDGAMDASQPSPLSEHGVLGGRTVSSSSAHSDSMGSEGADGASSVDGSPNPAHAQHTRSAPFHSDLSPIAQSLRHTPERGVANFGHDASPNAAGALPLPPFPRQMSAPTPTHMLGETEAYVQYTTASLHDSNIGEHGAAADAQPVSAEHASLASFYPSTMPGPHNALPDGQRGTFRGASPPVESTRASAFPSPALSARSESQQRIPRVSRMLKRDKRESKRKSRTAGGNSASRDRRSAASAAQAPAVDIRSIYASRGDVQEQLQHLICVEHYRPTLPPDMPDRLAMLLTRAWHPNPQARPSAADFVHTLQALARTLRGESSQSESEHAASGAVGQADGPLRAVL